MSNKITTQNCVDRLRKLYGELYDYSKVNYINNNTPIILHCNKHHLDFQSLPNNLYKNHIGCPLCIKEKKERNNSNKFINKLQEQAVLNDFIFCLNGNEKAKDKITCKCLKCNTLFKKDLYHLLRGSACQKCSREQMRLKKCMSQEEAYNRLIQISQEKHYSFKPFEYVNQHQYIDCYCEVCGHKWRQTYNHLIRGRGCSVCAWKENTDKFRYTEDEIMKELTPFAERNHYKIISIKGYVNNTTPNIICECNRCNKQFNISLSNAKHNNACPNHNNSKGENYIESILKKYNINYSKQVHSNIFKWLKRQSLDFYLPDYNIAIEYQGKQHFCDNTTFKYFNFEKQIKLDELKYNLCKKHNIEIVYFTLERNDIPNKYIGNLYNDINKLLNDYHLI